MFAQVLRQRQISCVLHDQCRTPLLWSDNFARISTESDPYRANDEIRTFAAAVHGTDSNWFGKSRDLDGSGITGDRGGLQGKRPAAQNHPARVVLFRANSVSNAAMKRAIPSEQVGGLNAHGIQA